MYVFCMHFQTHSGKLDLDEKAEFLSAFLETLKDPDCNLADLEEYHVKIMAHARFDKNNGNNLLSLDEVKAGIRNLVMDIKATNLPFEEAVISMLRNYHHKDSSTSSSSAVLENVKKCHKCSKVALVMCTQCNTSTCTEHHMCPADHEFTFESFDTETSMQLLEHAVKSVIVIPHKKETTVIMRCSNLQDFTMSCIALSQAHAKMNTLLVKCPSSVDFKFWSSRVGRAAMKMLLNAVLPNVVLQISIENQHVGSYAQDIDSFFSALEPLKSVTRPVMLSLKNNALEENSIQQLEKFTEAIGQWLEYIALAHNKFDGGAVKNIKRATMAE